MSAADDDRIGLLAKHQFLGAAAQADGLVGRDMVVLWAALQWVGRDPKMPPSVFWRSVEGLAADTGLPRSTVHKSITKWRQLGVLIQVAEPKRSMAKARRFYVPFECLLVENGRPTLSFLTRKPGSMPRAGATKTPSSFPYHGETNGVDNSSGSFPYGGETSVPMAGKRPSLPQGNDRPYGREGLSIKTKKLRTQAEEGVVRRGSAGLWTPQNGPDMRVPPDGGSASKAGCALSPNKAGKPGRKVQPVAGSPAPNVYKLCACGWTVDTIAQALEVHPQTVRGWHQGRLRPSPERLVQLQHLLGASH